MLRPRLARQVLTCTAHILLGSHHHSMPTVEINREAIMGDTQSTRTFRMGRAVHRKAGWSPNTMQ